MAETDIPITIYDGLDRRCPKLGHDVMFEYCRCEGGDVPCRSVLTCWWDRFDVPQYLSTHLSKEQIAQLQQPKPEKLTSLVDLINQARQRAADAAQE
jgi:hypothetical protein